MLLAPIAALGAGEEPIQTYIRAQEKLRHEQEIKRLAYVAATRAKSRLHLIAELNVDAATGEIKTPPPGSVLSHLWQALGGQFALPAPAAPAPAGPLVAVPRTLERLLPDWTPAPTVEALQALPAVSAVPPTPAKIEFDWAGETARNIGTITHRWLQMFGRSGVGQWNEDRVIGQREAIRAALAALGTDARALDSAVQKTVAALTATLSDPRGRWIFSSDHREARCEYALSGRLGDRAVRYVIDRTFVDAADQRWIIDFKTGVHLGADVDAFLDREMQRYEGQLSDYARLLQARETRPIRLGLYFPFMRGWREWASAAAEQGPLP